MEARKKIHNTTITENVVSYPGLGELTKAKRRAKVARATVEAAMKERTDAGIKLKRPRECDYLN